MIDGNYQCGPGLLVFEQMQLALANNLAMVGKYGWEDETPDLERGWEPEWVFFPDMDFLPGRMQVTDVPSDIALAGAGFFTVATGCGKAYTRNGHFHLDREGRLLTSEGYAVLGKKGAIVLPDTKFVINSQGEVYCGVEIIDQLAIDEPDGQTPLLNNNLLAQKYKNASLAMDGKRLQVVQGALEASNGDVIASMIDMIQILEFYKANQKYVENQEEI